MEEREKSVRPSVNARMKPEQGLFVAGPLLASLLAVAVGAIAGWDWLLFLGVPGALAAAVWCIIASVMIMRNRRRRLYRGFGERSSFWDFLMGR